MRVYHIHRYQTIRKIIISLLPLGLWMMGCNNSDEEGGSLQLSYQLGSGKDCDELDIKRVTAVLNDDEYREEVACDKKEIRFNDVEPGTYTLQLFGFDSDNDAVMDSEPQEDIKITAAKTLTIDTPIRIVDAPARLKLRWDFEFSDCKDSGLGGFRITAFTADGSDVLLTQSISCEFDSIDDDGYHILPDPDRELKGNDFGEVSIQPLDSNDTELGEPIAFVFEESPGPGGVVKLSLECGDTGCTGSGEPD